MMICHQRKQHLLAAEDWHDALGQPAAAILLYPLPCLLCHDQKKLVNSIIHHSTCMPGA
jgi:hypothetical protein